ncbi:substrate-binding domain-containing protein [Phenylobacterium sp. LjRoot219]
MAGAIATFRQRYPAIELKLLELRPHEILEGVRNGSQDFGLITLYGKTSLPGFHTEIVHGLDTVLISGGPRPAGPLAIADLLHREWLDADVGDPATGYISTLMSGLGLPLPKRILRCSSIHLCARLAVELGVICGVTRIALPSLRSEIEAGALTPLDVTADLPRMNVALAFPDEELMSPAARELARLLRARFGGSRAPIA